MSKTFLGSITWFFIFNQQVWATPLRLFQLNPSKNNEDCSVKKLNPADKKWLPLKAEETPYQTFSIAKVDAKTGMSYFMINKTWYLAKTTCLVEAKTNNSDPKYQIRSVSLASSFFLVGHRKAPLTLSNSSATYPVIETWYGVILGFQKPVFTRSRFSLRTSADLEIGMANAEQDATVTDQIHYKNSALITMGARIFPEIQYQLLPGISLLLNSGLLTRYGRYLVPEGFNPISNFNFNLVYAAGGLFRVSAKDQIRFEVGGIGSLNRLFLNLGIQIGFDP